MAEKSVCLCQAKFENPVVLCRQSKPTLKTQLAFAIGKHNS